MASKKTKKKNAASDNSKGSAKSADTGPAGVDVVTAEMYEIRIRSLNEKINREHEKLSELQAENKTLVDTHLSAANEKKDIVEFLRIELNNNEVSRAKTEQLLAELQAERASAQRAHIAEYENLKKQFETEQSEMSIKLARLNQEMNQVADFRDRKETLEREIACVTSELASRERNYTDQIAALERKTLHEKQALRRDMIAKVTDAVAVYRRAVDASMAETTKRAIRENAVVTSQLHKLTTGTTDLVSENHKLRAANAALMLDNSMLKDTEKRLLRKNLAGIQTIRRLLCKLSELATALDNAGALENEEHPNNQQRQAEHDNEQKQHKAAKSSPRGGKNAKKGEARDNPHAHILNAMAVALHRNHAQKIAQVEMEAVQMHLYQRILAPLCQILASFYGVGGYLQFAKLAPNGAIVSNDEDLDWREQGIEENNLLLIKRLVGDLKSRRVVLRLCHDDHRQRSTSEGPESKTSQKRNLAGVKARVNSRARRTTCPPRIRTHAQMLERILPNIPTCSLEYLVGNT